VKKEFDTPAPLGRIASLHLHPTEPGELLQTVSFIEVEKDKGIVGNPRKFAKRDSKGEFSKRQVTLIEREQIAEHAAALGLETIAAGRIRSNIETDGVNLINLIGKEIQIGDAILFFYEARTGCSQMDDLCQGLRELAKGNRLGVLAQVIHSGRIQVGDAITLAK
jgi:MOSC domain-containing protein YiiM